MANLIANGMSAPLTFEEITGLLFDYIMWPSRIRAAESAPGACALIACTSTICDCLFFEGINLRENLKIGEVSVMSDFFT